MPRIIRTRPEKPPIDTGNTIMTVGSARLFKTFTGKILLIGGSPAEVAQIRKWTDQFLANETIEVRP